MIDSGETDLSMTAIREFTEEAMDLNQSNEDLNKEELIEKKKEEIKKDISELQKIPIYQGYVDDPRNTDNSWMETSVFVFHDENNNILNKFNLKAGDDARNVKLFSIIVKDNNC